MQGLAQSGGLAVAIQHSFGQTEDQTALNQIVQAIAQGDASALPEIVSLDSGAMPGMVGAYSADTRTIYLNSQVAEHAPSVLEALTHELGHFIGSEFFSARAGELDVVDFLYALLGQDHSLMLSAAVHEPESHQGLITLPDSGQTVEVQGFKTDLHISWMQNQLPMLNANAFNLRTGDVVDPRDGTLTENLLLGLENIDRYSVFSATAPRSGPVQRTADFLIDKDLDPDNLALLPYLKVNAAGTKSLYFSSASSSPDGISHIAKLNQSGFACEDLVGSDYDFDDLAVLIRSVSLTDYY